MTPALVAGAALGVLYTLSPLTVLSLAAIAMLTWYVARGQSPRERGWFLGLVGAAMALRLAAVAGLFLFADPAQPYANFFGDEELFKQRTVWLRNAFLDVPISPADMIYVFDDVGRSSYLYGLAYIQALVGDSPYGLNVLNCAVYVAAVIVMFVFFRRIYGRAAALAGAALLLFVPSLFSWSISVLKEPAYILLAAVEVMCAVQIVCARTWPRRALAAAGVGIGAWILGSLRVGGAELAIAGTLVGVPAGLMVTRPRWLWATLVAVPVVAAVLLMQPRVQERVMRRIADAAFVHWGHVFTPGNSFKLLDQRFYTGGPRSEVYTMTGAETTRYVARAGVEFVTAPRPSQVRSRSALAYLPEQALWYALLALVPIGVVAGLAHAPVATCVLLAHGLVASAMVALTGGNIGTLIRHRGLTLPYFTWLAAYGGCVLVRWMLSRSSTPSFAHIQGARHGLG